MRFAAYRLMPALQQIYGAFTQLRFAGPALEALHKDLNEAFGGAKEVKVGGLHTSSTATAKVSARCKTHPSHHAEPSHPTALCWPSSGSFA